MKTNILNKNFAQHHINLIAGFLPTCEIPRGLSIRFLFAKLGA
jgi:hypothetical protein